MSAISVFASCTSPLAIAASSSPVVRHLGGGDSSSGLPSPFGSAPVFPVTSTAQRKIFSLTIPGATKKGGPSVTISPGVTT